MSWTLKSELVAHITAMISVFFRDRLIKSSSKKRFKEYQISVYESGAIVID